MSTELVVMEANTQSVSIFNNGAAFEHAQRIANMLTKSDIVPAQYKNNLPNTLVALEMAHRIGASPLAVMQNMNVIHGKPSWSSTFIIASINTCGKFHPLRFSVSGSGDELTCVAWTIEKATNERLDGPPVSIAMAKKEGWFGKTGSKWQTMPELMLRYRAAAFFGRLYAPEVMMGMHASEEVEDFGAKEVKHVSSPASQIVDVAELNAQATQRKPRKKLTTEQVTVAHTSDPDGEIM